MVSKKKRGTKQNPKPNKRNIVTFTVLFLFLIAVSLYLIFFIDAQKIVSMVGLQNIYIIMFFLTFIMGLSSFSGGLVYTLLFAFLKGGAHPVMLGAVAGLGIIAGDLLFYYIFSKGYQSMPSGIQKRFSKTISYLEKKNAVIIPFFVTLWTFLPLPNDVMSFSLSILGYPFKKMYPYIVIGDLAHMLLVSMLFSITFF